MNASDLQLLCEAGQQELMRMEYLQAEKTLARAEQIAWEVEDWDALSRLYMPLQEARRQRRQRCGEGMVCLDLIAKDACDLVDPAEIIRKYPHGQLLVAGWGSVAPAMELRRLQAERGLYVETFLAAVYPAGATRVVAIVPLETVQLPDPREMAIDKLIARLPPHSLVIPVDELPKGNVKGTPTTYGKVMDLWEKLHAPFLAMADNTSDPRRKIEEYRKTIRVDYACELAHQKLSDTARKLELAQA